MNNKYSNTYIKICLRAFGRQQDVTQYYEKHHIVPKSLGGKNTKLNLVCLTGREHFICHWLLTKFTTGKDRSKMIYAWHTMTYVSSDNQKRYVPSSRVFEIIKKENAKARSEATKGIFLGEKNSFYGKTHSDIVKQNIGESKKGNTYWVGRKHSDSAKRKIASFHLGRKASEETRKKMSKTRAGKPSYVRTDEIKQKMAEAQRKYIERKKSIAFEILKKSINTNRVVYTGDSK